MFCIGLISNLCQIKSNTQIHISTSLSFDRDSILCLIGHYSLLLFVSMYMHTTCITILRNLCTFEKINGKYINCT